MDDLKQAVSILNGFSTPESLTVRIAELERSVRGADGEQLGRLLETQNVTPQLFAAAALVKRMAGQINVLIHATGILLALPHLLAPEEEVMSVSLGAGNTGRKFDLETNLQVAEFKFIDWRGGAEAIRQNSVFVDIFNLLGDGSGRRRVMYLRNKAVPIKFLHGGRAISSVLSKSSGTAKEFSDRHGDKYQRVSQWYAAEAKGNVEIVDLKDVLPRNVPVPTET